MSDFFFLHLREKINTFRIQNLTIHFDEFFMARKVREITQVKKIEFSVLFSRIFFSCAVFTENWVFWREFVYKYRRSNLRQLMNK